MFTALWTCLLLLTTGARAEDGFLDPSLAFRFQSSEVPGAVKVTFHIADGYYLYRERFGFAVKLPSTATLGAPQIPPGKTHFDQTFDKNVETYRGDVTMTVPVNQANGPFDLAVTSQGCSDKGVCYPPAQHLVHVDGAALQPAAPGDTPSTNADNGTRRADAVAPAPSGMERFYSQDYATSVLADRGLPAVLGIFFVLGIALSLLPCSLPMIPILSSIILGEGTALTRRRGFALSLAYVLGMAVVYTVFGLVAALAGQSLGAVLQNPWVLGVFAGVLVIFALSQLGCYDVQLPGAWQSRVSGVSRRLRGGKMAAVFVMGALSALVVGACMTAPLFGVLAFIAQTGDVVHGGASLFVMALGIGVPLLVVGVGAGSVLPRAGAWMDSVKRVFGVVLLGAAVWIVGPALPAGLTLWLWSAIAALSACGLLVGARTVNAGASLGPRHDAWRWIRRALGIVAAMYAVTLALGAAGGARDPLTPLAVYTASNTDVLASGEGARAASAASAGPAFATVRTLAQLASATTTDGRPTMLFFHADWCTSCVEMERFVFTDPQVQASMARLGLLQADVTANDADDQALLKRFGLFGPPAILFFDAHGNELKSMRVVGYQSSARFIATLDRVMSVAATSRSAASVMDAASAATGPSGNAGTASAAAPDANTSAVAAVLGAVDANSAISAISASAPLAAGRPANVAAALKRAIGGPR